MVNSSPRARRSKSTKKGLAIASGWTAEQMSLTIPGASPRSRVREPPPIVGWASRTSTESPARAMVTAAARPLGPDPTTTTSGWVLMASV